jgi:hypothetical protein
VWVCVCVGSVTCVSSGNMCTCIYCVLYCWYCVFVLFRLCICFLVLSVLPPSDNSITVNNNNNNNNNNSGYFYSSEG